MSYTSYNIQINEEQREFIEEGLEILLKQHFKTTELEVLVTMIKDLPEVEKEHPRVLHGLCL